MISFQVDGDPYPQGSMRKSRQGKIIHDPKTVVWRNQVATVAKIACRGHRNVEVGYTKKIHGKVRMLSRFVCYDEPVLVWTWFRFVPLASGPRVGDLDGVIGSTYDVDKLFRAVGDALEAAELISNDKRIAGWPVFLARRHSEIPGLDCIVSSVREARLCGIIPDQEYRDTHMRF